ncbi:hypothetical protein Droror1_Dr00000169 [Drosera rotundifolia]
MREKSIVREDQKLIHHRKAVADSHPHKPIIYSSPLPLTVLHKPLETSPSVQDTPQQFPNVVPRLLCTKDLPVRMRRAVKAWVHGSGSFISWILGAFGLWVPVLIKQMKGSCRKVVKFAVLGSGAAVSRDLSLRPCFWEDVVGTTVLKTTHDGLRFKDEVLVICKRLKDLGKLKFNVVVSRIEGFCNCCPAAHVRGFDYQVQGSPYNV